MTEPSHSSSKPAVGPSATPPSQVPGRSFWFRLLRGVLILVLCLGLLLFAGGWYLRGWLKNQGVEGIHLQVRSWSAEHLELERLAFVRSSSGKHRRLEVQAEDIRLDWYWRLGLPRFETAQVQQVQVSVGSGAVTGGAFLAHETLAPQDWSVPDWLPRQISVGQFHGELPCADRRCQLSGSAQLLLQQQTAALQVRLEQGEHKIQIDLQGALKGGADLTAVVYADDMPATRGQASVSSIEAEKVRWQGHWQVSEGAYQPWLLQWLSQWQPKLEKAAWLQPLSTLALAGNWDMQLPSQMAAGGLQPALNGELNLTATLGPTAKAPLVEMVQGALELRLDVQNGQVERYQLQAEGQLTRLPGVEHLAGFEGLDPGPVQVQVRSQGEWQGLEGTEPLLEVELESSGELAGVGQGQIRVALQGPVTAELREARLQLRSPQVDFAPQVRLQNASAELYARGHWRQDEYRLELEPASWIRADQLELPELLLEQARLETAGFVIEGQGESPHLQGQLSLATSRLVQDQLHPQSWQSQGVLGYGNGVLSIRGEARAHGGLTIEYGFLRQPDQPMALDWSVPQLYFLAANPLPALLKQWPELLEVSRGKLSAQGRVTFPGEEEPLELEARMQLWDLGGIYDRMLVDGLSADLSFHKEGEQVMLGSQFMQVKRLNPGVEMGPLQIAGSYTSQSSDLLKGMVALRQLELGLLGGRVWAEPVHFDLSDNPVRVPLLIRGIDLSRILELYASQDLSGHGTLDGNLPLMVSSQGIAVAEGSLYARPPGGVLRYSHDQVRNMARNDARMELLAEVLENFHYSLLSSDITYADDGQLKLGVRLQGRNPQMRDSPPVHLNINLEENLPMLLASLQMASNLSDTVKKRVNEALRQRQATKSP